MNNHKNKNCYGDSLDIGNAGHGVDIATQRRDDLDNICLAQIAQVAARETASIFAADVGCGQGSMAYAMASLGANVVAVDKENLLTFHHNNITHVVDDMREALAKYNEKFHVILCQRTIHYLPYTEAEKTLRSMRQALHPEGILYLSASGLDSELGNDYPAKERRVQYRFCHLEGSMARKHQILAPVCLYRQQELRILVSDAGLNVAVSWVSPFGNIKLVASR